MSTFWGITSRLEPKRAFKATLDINSPAVKWPRFLIAKFSRPGVTEMLQPAAQGMPADGTPFSIDKQWKYRQNPTFKPLQVVFIEDSRSRRNNTALTVYTFLSYLGFTGDTPGPLSVEIPGTPLTDPTTLTADKYAMARNIIGNQWSINELRPNGSTFATWTIIEPFIQSAVFSDYDYNSEELTTVTLEVQYKKFKYEDKRRRLSSHDPGFDPSLTTGAAIG